MSSGRTNTMQQKMTKNKFPAYGTITNLRIIIQIMAMTTDERMHPKITGQEREMSACTLTKKLRAPKTSNAFSVASFKVLRVTKNSDGSLLVEISISFKDVSLKTVLLPNSFSMTPKSGKHRPSICEDDTHQAGHMCS